jgi:hypothetical protein
MSDTLGRRRGQSVTVSQELFSLCFFDIFVAINKIGKTPCFFVKFAVTGGPRNSRTFYLRIRLFAICKNIQKFKIREFQ